MTSESKDWSNVRLSLEKPYKDPNGVPLKKVLDISNEEEFIYEQPKAIDEQLGTRLQRVFDERGNAIWDEYTPSWGEELPDAREASDENEEDDEDEESEEDDSYNVKKKPMTVEELTKLRMETVPTLM
jgi:mediator of RNA polymerase II transcription subunit 17